MIHDSKGVGTIRFKVLDSHIILHIYRTIVAYPHTYYFVCEVFGTILESHTIALGVVDRKGLTRYDINITFVAVAICKCHHRFTVLNLYSTSYILP